MSWPMNGTIYKPTSMRNQGRATRKRKSRSQESGFAYLMALFRLLFMLIASSAAILDLRTERRRQREEEMIWRGNQYVRAIRLYYRKTGHYPQNLDDLQKGLPELHFLRFATYKDPLNKSDGAWRFIYVNAAGQIIGSVKYATLQQMAIMELNGGKMPTTSSGLPGMPPVSPTGSSRAFGQGSGSATGAQPGQGATAAPSGQFHISRFRIGTEFHVRATEPNCAAVAAVFVAASTVRLGRVWQSYRAAADGSG